MRRICLTLPTDRPCPRTIAALGAEAAYAVAHHGVEVRLLILDSCETEAYQANAAAVRDLPAIPHTVVHHLDEAAQEAFLRKVIGAAEATKPDLLLDLMLPSRLSYGACTNRAFLLAAALGCRSVHRRDSDSRYQVVDGATVFPVHHELRSLGRPAAEAASGVSRTALAAEHRHKRVAMVGGSFVGELSVDIGEMQALDRDVYHDVVSLWAPPQWSAQQKRELVEESFRGAGSEPFTQDDSLLTLVDPMRVDMCNISFHGVHERVPLPPATDTIGSDYFLIHLVHDAALPGVLHNRNIVNYYTPERRTDAGFVAYQTRFVKFLLSMRYLNVVYDRMAQDGAALLDGDGEVSAPAVADLVHGSTHLDQAENVWRLDRIDAAYRRLGGRYAAFADRLAPRRERLLDEARRDMEDFAVLAESWAALVHAAHNCPPASATGRPA